MSGSITNAGQHDTNKLRTNLNAGQVCFLYDCDQILLLTNFMHNFTVRTLNYSFLFLIMLLDWITKIKV